MSYLDVDKLNFAELRRANLDRTTASFHAINAWSPTDWTTALAGEVGEAANLIKKLRRGDLILDEEFKGSIVRGHTGRQLIADELADVAIYLDLLAQRLEIDLGEAIREKFNETSIKVGSDVRL